MTEQEKPAPPPTSNPVPEFQKVKAPYIGPTPKASK